MTSPRWHRAYSVPYGRAHRLTALGWSAVCHALDRGFPPGAEARVRFEGARVEVRIEEPGQEPIVMEWANED